MLYGRQYTRQTTYVYASMQHTHTLIMLLKHRKCSCACKYAYIHTHYIQYQSCSDAYTVKARLLHTHVLACILTPTYTHTHYIQYQSCSDADTAEKLYRRALLIDPADVGTLINYGSLIEEVRKDRWSAQVCSRSGER
jgi:hypothetical protein